MEPDQLFSGAESDEPLVDFEGLQFETAAEGAYRSTSKDSDCRLDPCIR